MSRDCQELPIFPYDGELDQRLGEEKNGQIVESTPSRPRRYHLARIADAGSVPCSATTIQRPTVLGWAFSFAESAHHAEVPAILRVPPAGRPTATTRPVRPYSALSSLESCANFFAVALADGVVHQPLVRVPTEMVGSRVCTSKIEGQTREASLNVSPWAGTDHHRSCCAHGSGHHALG